MSFKRTIISNTFAQLAGRFGTSLFGFLTTLVIARFLGAEQYGIYAKVYALLAFFYLFIDFGFNAVYVRSYKDDFSRLRIVNQVRTIFFVVSVLVMALFLLITNSHVFSAHEQWLVYLFAPTALFFGYSTSMNIIFQVKLRYDLSAIAAIVGGATGLLLVVASLPYGISFVIGSVMVGYGVGALFSYFFARHLVPFSFFGALNAPNNLKNIVRFIQYAGPIGAVLFLNTIYFRADVFVLSALKSNVSVGIYQLAYKFFEFPLAFATFFANALFPHYIQLYQSDRKQFGRLFKKATGYLVLVGILFGVGGFIVAPFLSLVRPEYTASVLPLRILVSSYPIFFLSSALNWLIFIQKRERSLLAIYAFSAVINIGANWYFIPRFDFLASAWITMGGEFLLLLMLLFIIKTAPKK